MTQNRNFSHLLIPFFIIISILVLFLADASSAFDPSEEAPPEKHPVSTATPTERLTPRDARIVGGQDADPGEYPWQVRVSPSGFLCGGTLIDREWVLTAAHCVVTESNAPMSPSDVSVVLGDHNLSGNDGTEQSINTSQVIVHPQYGSAGNDYDIALLKLASPANIVPGTVETIELNTDANLAAGTNAVVTGWGTTSSGGSISQILQEVTVPLVSNQTCAGSYGSTITDNMICAGFQAGGKDACQGDSGGPLVIQTGSGGWKHVGIVSFGNGCAAPDFYGVYARTSRFIDWIETNSGITVGENPNPTSTPQTGPTATPFPTTTPFPTVTPTPTGENLLDNGNFDSSEHNAGWEEFSSGDYDLIGSFDNYDNVIPYSPPGLAWLGGANDETSRISKELTLPSTRQVGEATLGLELRFVYKISSSDVCGVDRATVYIDNDTEQFDLCSTSQTDNWVSYSSDITHMAGETITLAFEVSNDDSVPSSFFIDDVEVIRSITIQLEDQGYFPFIWSE